MKTITFKNNALTIIAALLAFPTAYFIIANVLNEMGITGPLQLIGSFVENAGAENPPGWNINLQYSLWADSCDPSYNFPVCEN